METESEPYVRLATLRQLHQVVAELNTARSLADTLQTVADGVVEGLGYEMAAVNLVRPDGDLVVAAVAGSPAAEAMMAGRVGSRASWERRLAMGERWGDAALHPVHRGLGPRRRRRPAVAHRAVPGPRQDEWHPMDRLFAPLYALRRRTARRASPSTSRATAAAPAPGAARRCRCTPSRPPSRSATRGCAPTCSARWSGWSGSSRRCARARRASGRRSSTRPAGWPSPRWAATSTGGCCAINDALCRLLGRPASAMRRYSFSDLVHPEDIGTLLRTSAEGGRAELRLARRDGTLRLGLAAQLRGRRHRRRAPLPAHARRGHRGAQAARAPARPPRQPRLADRAAQQRRAARPARAAGCAPSAVRRGRERARPWTSPPARRSAGPWRPTSTASARTGSTPAFGAGAAPVPGPGVPYDHHVHAVAPRERRRRRREGARRALLRPGRLQVDQRPVRAQHAATPCSSRWPAG